MTGGMIGWTRVLRGVLAVASLVLVAGCAITPKAGPSCGFVRYPLMTKTPTSTRDLLPDVDAVSRAVASQPGDRSPLGLELDRALGGTRGVPFEGRPIDDSMLFLSGGSQHGAFGAGYLAEWAANRKDGLPKFAVVTGVSTGSILSTFAFVNRTDVPLAEYSIPDESVLLRRLVGFRNGSPTIWGYVQMVRKGAIADLGPLRERLSTVLTDDVLTKVAEGAQEGRLLVIGVVDVDTGQAYALDMTRMALRWQAARKRSTEGDGIGDDAGRLKACYVEAVVASSSAPMAALPVMIDNRMYIDGGARFGAFSDEVGAALDNRRRTLATAKAPRIYLLVNGYQMTPSKCGRADPAFCIPPGSSGADPTDYGHPHGKWQFLALALRSESILSNQVYRFSAESVAYQAKIRGADITYAQLGEDALGFEYHEPGESGKTTCAGAQAKDRKALDPVQFFPRYMRCIIAYGRSKAAEAGFEGYLP